MSEKKLKIKIDAKGNMSYTVEGVMGAKCMGQDYSFLDDLAAQVVTKTTEDFTKQEEERNFIFTGGN